MAASSRWNIEHPGQCSGVLRRALSILGCVELRWVIFRVCREIAQHLVEVRTIEAVFLARWRFGYREQTLGVVVPVLFGTCGAGKQQGEKCEEEFAHDVQALINGYQVLQKSVSPNPPQ